jgi:uncharacterized protein (TIGR02284 family)
MSYRNDLTHLLNTLLKYVEDGKKGFRQAADNSNSPQVKPMLQECADDCTRALHALQQCVQSLGERAVGRGSARSAVGRGWARLKSAVSPVPVLAALDEVEHEQGEMEAAFAAVLAAQLPPAIRSVVQRESILVVRNRNRLRSARWRYLGDDPDHRNSRVA